MKEQRLSEQAYAQIKQLIKDRNYLPGDPLPENELSTRLHMSRTPIREALHRLEEEQVVTIKPRLGTFVATVDFGQLCNLYETREAVDGMIANLLCKPHINIAPFLQLKSDLLQIKDNPDDADRITKLHAYSSHYVSVLRTLCGNQMLEKLSASISIMTDSMGQVTHAIPLFPDAAVPERLAVLDAIIDKDASRAENAARQHVRNVFSRIMATAIH